MSAHFRSTVKQHRSRSCLPVLAMTITSLPVSADGTMLPGWIAAKLPAQASQVVISHRSDRVFVGTQRTYVVTHGLHSFVSLPGGRVRPGAWSW